MNRAVDLLSRLCLGTYIQLRRKARCLVARSPLLDRTLGDLLRSVEARSGLPTVLAYTEPLRQISARGITLTYRPQDASLATHIRLNGDYEPETADSLVQLLRPGMTFVDLGAHIGYFTVLAAKLVAPSGQVYAFEPVPARAVVLATNVRLNGVQNNVILERLAVVDRPRVVFLRVPEAQSVSASVVASPSELESTGERLIQVQATSLDHYFRENGWPAVHLVKIDVEGSELAVLQGMKELVYRNPNLHIICEINYPRLHHSPKALEDLIQAWVNLGYTQVRPLRNPNSETWNMPEDLQKALKLARRMTFNALCSRS